MNNFRDAWRDYKLTNYGRLGTRSDMERTKEMIGFMQLRFAVAFNCST